MNKKYYASIFCTDRQKYVTEMVGIAYCLGTYADRYIFDDKNDAESSLQDLNDQYDGGFVLLEESKEYVDQVKDIKEDIEKVLRQMSAGRNREWSEGVVDRIFATNVINDKCIEDDIVIDENMIVSALMEVVYRDYT